MNFLEKLSCLLGKQYIFKQKKNRYYNKYLSIYQTKLEVQEWLLDMLREEVII
jgi:hypothetical protein